MSSLSLPCSPSNQSILRAAVIHSHIIISAGRRAAFQLEGCEFESDTVARLYADVPDAVGVGRVQVREARACKRPLCVIEGATACR
jgi:hypothetical protein